MCVLADDLGFILCSCCSRCYEHCVCTGSCGEIEFLECMPNNCFDCEDKYYD